MLFTHTFLYGSLQIYLGRSGYCFLAGTITVTDKIMGTPTTIDDLYYVTGTEITTPSPRGLHHLETRMMALWPIPVAEGCSPMSSRISTCESKDQIGTA